MASTGAKVVIAVSKAARKLGQSLDKIGAELEVVKYTERLVPSTRFVAVDGVAPLISDSVSFVAPSANVIGHVTIGEKSSIWYGATVRSDTNKVVIGRNSNIGDRALVYDSTNQERHFTFIGNNVTVGPGAIVHAATVEDCTVVGASAQILEGSVVHSKSIIAPGSILTPGTLVPSGELWAGSPAKMVRPLTTEESTYICSCADDKSDLAIVHARECAKNFEQVVADEEAYQDKLERDPEYWQPNCTDTLGQGSRGRIFDSSLSHPEEWLKIKPKQKE